MKTISWVLSAIAILALVGCSATTVRTDYDQRSSFAQLRTYMWLDQPVTRVRNPSLNSPLLKERIQNAVDGELAKRGYRRLTSGEPDFVVAYYVVADDKVEVTTDDYGHGYYGYPGRYGGGSIHTQEYVEGTLILDIIDPAQQKVIWRGWAIKALDDKPHPKEVEMYVNRAVEKILKQFPPS